MTRLLVAVAAVAALTTALPAAAQFQRPEQAVAYRKAGMTLMGAHMGRIAAMTSGRAPFDAAAATANAEVVAFVSKLPYAGFVEGSDKVEGTRAKSNIWTERAKFDAEARKMQDAVAALVGAARANNLDQLKAAFGTAIATCNSCHDTFRAQ